MASLRTTLALFLAGALLTPAGLFGQAPERRAFGAAAPDGFGPERPELGSLARPGLVGTAQARKHPGFSAAALQAFAPERQEVEGGGRDWPRYLLAGLSGAAVGAGLGFVASQVLVGDWDEEGESPNRGLWMGLGGGIGLAVGLVIGPPPRRAAGEELPRWREEPGRAVLAGEEIRASSARSAWELIDSRRPEWLVIRGTGSWSGGRGQAVEGRSGGREARGEAPMDEGSIPLKVYLDDVLLGGVDALREVDVGNIASLHRLTAAQATQRWGSGHANGAILIITVR